MAWTPSQIDKLGDRLRQSDPPDAQAFADLQILRLTYDPPMREVETILRGELQLEATSRLKTSNTIIEKLRREKTRLHTMQDIAGLRIVRDMTLAEQDALVEQIRSKLPNSKVVDRRLKPSYGYRAVHVIATVQGKPVEIQERTGLQHLWAQTVERTADRVGRGLRYGQFPAGSLDATRAQVNALLSESIAHVESRGLKARRGFLLMMLDFARRSVRAPREGQPK